MKRLIFLLHFFTAINIFAEPLSYGIEFLNVPFETFVQRICPDKDERSAFYTYYDQLMRSYAELSHEKRSLCVEQLQIDGLSQMKIKHPLLAEKIALKENKNESLDDIQCLLTRYGAFEQFSKERIRASNSMWKRVKHYAGQVKTKVVGWVDGFKKSLKV